jgi:curved DNA-binding protein CbpA
MKDYYKILGITEIASGGDIRTRWIELMRKFHPDGKHKGGAEERRLREINEAYAVLKYPSTRVEYDLKRAYHRRRKRMYLLRMILPAGILIVFLALGLVYSKKRRIAPLPEPTNTSARRSIDVKVNHPPSPLPIELTDPHPVKGLNDGTRFNASTKPHPLKRIEASPPVSKAKRSTNIRKAVSVPSQPDVPSPVTAPSDKNMTVAHRSTVSKPSIEVKEKSAPVKLPPTVTRSKTPARGKKAAPRPIVKSSEIKHTPLPKPKPPEDITDPNHISEHKDPNHIEVAHLLVAPNLSIRVEGQIAQGKPASLIATEEEVRQFFALYLDRYTKKDIDGFHSLFSSKAIQNRKDGSDEIRKIYSQFFDQSQELRYHMEDTRIEIYQNAVCVKARYIVDQRLKKGGGKKVGRGNIRWILVREKGVLRIRYLDYKQWNPRNARMRGQWDPNRLP